MNNQDKHVKLIKRAPQTNTKPHTELKTIRQNKKTKT